MRLSLVAAALVAMAGCGTSPAHSGSPPRTEPASGIRGVTSVGPACPVQVVERPCPDHPLKAVVSITRSGSKHVVESVTTGSDGRFSFTLAPGRYLLIGRPQERLPISGVQQRSVTVQRGTYSRLTLRFDSGIR